MVRVLLSLPDDTVPMWDLSASLPSGLKLSQWYPDGSYGQWMAIEAAVVDLMAVGCLSCS